LVVNISNAKDKPGSDKALEPSYKPFISDERLFYAGNSQLLVRAGRKSIYLIIQLKNFMPRDAVQRTAIAKSSSSPATSCKS
jgi:hypothetical protein